MNVTIVNTETFPGKKITKVLGLVYETSMDGNCPRGYTLIDFVIASMQQKAESMGANAIIGFTLNSNISISNNTHGRHVTAYGTAVVVEE